MLTIYGVYRSRASRNFWLADELGLTYRHVPVIQANRAANSATPDAPLHTKSPAFLAVNPNGQIPAIDDDGLVMHQSLAINLHLARKHGGPLAPANAVEDDLMTMWSLWAAADIEPHAIQILYNRVGKPPAERDPRLADSAEEALRAPFAVLDGVLKSGGFVVGQRFTVADINVAEIFRYAMPAPRLFESNPNVKTWLAACHARPAFKAMMAKRDAEPA
jgi:glutathione S-transferase